MQIMPQNVYKLRWPRKMFVWQLILINFINFNVRWSLYQRFKGYKKAYNKTIRAGSFWMIG